MLQPRLPVVARALRRPLVAVAPGVRRHISTGGDGSQPTTRLGVLKGLLRSLVSSSRASEIHAYYPAVAQELQYSRHALFAPAGLAKHQLIHILRILAQSGRMLDFRRIIDILEDTPALLGQPPDDEVYTAVVETLVQAGRKESLSRFIVRISRLPGAGQLSEEPFHAAIRGLPQVGCTDLSLASSIATAMHACGPDAQPTRETVGLIIRARWAMKESTAQYFPRPVSFAAILRELKDLGVPHDPSIAELLREEYEARGHPHHGLNVARVYDEMYFGAPSADAQADAEEAELAARIATQACNKGLLSAAKALQASGRPLTPRLLNAVLRGSKSLSAMKHFREVLGVEPTAEQWAIVIENSCQNKSKKDALQLYDAAKARGIIPDVVMAYPLIRLLCRYGAEQADAEDLDRAIAIHDDVAHAPAAEDVSESHVLLQGMMYDELLRSLAGAPSPKRYADFFTTALDLIDKRHIEVHPGQRAASTAIFFMRGAPSEDAAYTAYEGARDSLDAPGYAAVLAHICRLRFRRTSGPPLKLYFDVVRDMRARGDAAAAAIEVYTIVLREIQELAVDANADIDDAGDMRRELVAMVRQIHDVLTLDAALTPGPAIWNTLMDTFQRLGCFADAYRVWQTLDLQGQVNATAVSIVLDACGRARAWPTACNIMDKLFKTHFRLNLKNWQSWVECLCRMRRFSEAVEVVCVQMGGEQVQPDIGCVLILLKFTMPWPETQAQVYHRIREHLPDLYEQLPQNWKDLGEFLRERAKEPSSSSQ
ncbi:hypothetical protein BD626DRAFT_628077 [Schizophyllum amplum]|uniref:Pentacotripeptide-repeat region of PRORP domain-containing protein n=1 Tax=Schizophyllum amplum TaxID=97359 RepID=A0A550CMW2_9AGAR|nr:hypothetical protein BD626DRAFT_628077 [Auriculariopsis ampla]